jgi:hypothetical protein
MLFGEIGIAIVVVTAVVVSLILWHGYRRRARGAVDQRAEIERIRLDDDISEIRRGDRPDPPAHPSDPGPDNLEPFARPSSEDERR